MSTSLNNDGSVQEVLLNSSYIENKIKSLLNRDDEVRSNSKTGSTGQSLNELATINGILAVEDSCNAVDNKISSESSIDIMGKVNKEDLSFNGKIRDLNSQVCSSNQSPINHCHETDRLRRSNNRKVSQDKLNESFEILTREDSSLMHYNNEKSPDLFGEDENDDDSGGDRNDQQSESEDLGEDRSFTSSANNTAISAADQVDRSILKRLQASLSGVLPPPSVTSSTLDAIRMLTLYREHENRYWCRNSDGKQTSNQESENDPELTCLSRPTHTSAEIVQIKWPEVLKAKAHGLYYNRSTITEKIELVGLKYVDRYIGAETCSTFNISRSPTNAKKRNLKMKSPGSRLSHLARRRAVFSSANLLNSSIGSAMTAVASSSSFQSKNPLRLCNRQILLDPRKPANRRKNKGRTPKRRTPSRRKTPRRRTPNSSGKKKALSLPVSKQPQIPVSRETSKRALFQSPPNSKVVKGDSGSTKGTISPTVASKVQKSKRALFSPPKRPQRLPLTLDDKSDLSAKEKLLLTNQRAAQDGKEFSGVTNLTTGEPVELGGPSSKRKRPVDPENNCSTEKSTKMRRMDSINEEDLTPRSLKLARSQSFCVGTQHAQNSLDVSLGGKCLFRANSEVAFPDSNSRAVTVLTENHKKKLLWAVSQALQAKQITVKHDNFKQYASNLARVVKRLFLEFNDQTVSSTSEKMLRFANNHVFEVIQGRSVDDIYHQEKIRILRSKNAGKLQGYITPEEYEQRKLFLKRNSSGATIISENSLDSFVCTSSSQQLQFSQSSTFSQSSEFLNQLSQSSARAGSVSTVPPVSTVVSELISSQNTALRENIDSEQRQKSTQKHVSFSGKDQKNLSPYADKSGSQVKSKLLVGGGVASSVLKAKRQISFE